MIIRLLFLNDTKEESLFRIFIRKKPIDDKEILT